MIVNKIGVKHTHFYRVTSRIVRRFALICFLPELSQSVNWLCKHDENNKCRKKNNCPSTEVSQSAWNISWVFVITTYHVCTRSDTVADGFSGAVSDTKFVFQTTNRSQIICFLPDDQILWFTMRISIDLLNKVTLSSLSKDIRFWKPSIGLFRTIAFKLYSK